MTTLGAVGATAATAGGALAAWGYTELTHFELHRYHLPILAPGTLRGEEEFRILHLSDLHMIPGQQAKIDFVSGLDALRPHLVVNTGDNLSDQRAVPDVLRALGPLLRRPGLFVFGTNDYWAPRPVNPLKYLTGARREPSYVDLPWQGMRAAFVEHGWLDANQARHEFPVGPVRIAAAGVDDPHHDLDDYDAIAGPPHPDADLTLALLHSPEPRVLSRFAADGYMLSLSGHTHGGQVCLPGGRAIITNCGIDPQRASGVHHFGRMIMSVSNGLGTSKYAPIRLFCRPSAALLTLTERPT
ncbi:metallophosphoesterase [Corynebacterium uberis]|uniref:metallophosphoesterase n=1 Tax=Corynebacterium uberis TaxID=2883169 RepID=UPI00237CC00A|nr:metallophosphoesterase [Corynebacterium sp. c6VSa_13]